jgi:hypothetical protein
MIPQDKNTGNEKFINVSLPIEAIKKIIELLVIEEAAWEYTVRTRQTGMPEEGLVTRDTKTTKDAQKMASFYRKLIRRLERSLKLKNK